MFLIKYVLLVSIFTQIIYVNQLVKLTDHWIKEHRIKLNFHMIVVTSCLPLILIHWSLYFLSLVLYFLVYHCYQRRLVQRHKNMIEFYGYKIFKFLINQISSGILISDAIKSMYRVVDEKNLRKTLIDVSAYYAKTSDLAVSLNILKERYKGMEVDSLCMAIEHGMYTGTNYETLRKMEQLLFKRYINQIKLETKWRKKRSIISVLLLCSIMIFMIAIPVVIDMMEAFNQIFLY